MAQSHGGDSHRCHLEKKNFFFLFCVWLFFKIISSKLALCQKKPILGWWYLVSWITSCSLSLDNHLQEEWLEQFSQSLQRNKGPSSKGWRERVYTKCVLSDGLINKAVSALLVLSYLQGLFWMLAFTHKQKRWHVLLFNTLYSKVDIILVISSRNCNRINVSLHKILTFSYGLHLHHDTRNLLLIVCVCLSCFL